MSQLYEFLETNETIFKVLGMALAIGNIMNGGTPKGRSDGFDLSVIAKLNTTKDNSNTSMLFFIMKQLVKADPELGTRFREANKVF